MDDSGMYDSQRLLMDDPQRLSKSRPLQPGQSQSQYDIHVFIGLPVFVGASPKGSAWLPLHSSQCSGCAPQPAAKAKSFTWHGTGMQTLEWISIYLLVSVADVGLDVYLPTDVRRVPR